MGGRTHHGPRSKRKLKGALKVNAKRRERDLNLEWELGPEEPMPPGPPHPQRVIRRP